MKRKYVLLLRATGVFLLPVASFMAAEHVITELLHSEEKTSPFLADSDTLSMDAPWYLAGNTDLLGIMTDPVGSLDVGAWNAAAAPGTIDPTSTSPGHLAAMANWVPFASVPFVAGSFGNSRPVNHFPSLFTMPASPARPIGIPAPKASTAPALPNRVTSAALSAQLSSVSSAASPSGGLSPTSASTVASSLNIDTQNNNSPYVVDGTTNAGGNYQNINVGLSQGGELDQSGGSLTANDFLLADGATGTFKFSGGTFTVTSGGEGDMGVDGTGSMVQTGGNFVAMTGSAVFIGRDGGSMGSLQLSAGTFDVSAAAQFLVGNNGSGTVTLSGTGLLKAGTVDLSNGNSGSASSGTFNLDGGTLQASGIAFFQGSHGNTSTFNFNGGTLQATADNTGFLQGLTTAQVRNGGAVIDTNGHNITISQPLVHSTISGDNATDGGLIKNGNGTLTLTAVETYNGGTTVNAGTLVLGDGTNAASFSGLSPGGSNGTAGGQAVTVNNAASFQVQSQATVIGGNGGNGGSPLLSNGGSGGTGGVGVAITGAATFSNTLGSTITGGSGGNGGGASLHFNGGNGGNGAAGVSFTGGGSPASTAGMLLNAGSITGGRGGQGGGGGFLGGRTGSSGSNGAGVSFSGGAGTLGNLSGGIINGGVSMDSAYANNVTLQIGSTITGGLNIGTNSGSTLTLTDDGSGGSQTYSASVSGTTTFAGALIKNGAGTWTLDQAMNYTGGTLISGGSLVAANASALGAAPGTTTVASGAQLVLSADNINEPVTLNGFGTASNGALESSAASRTFTGAITLGSDAFVVSASAGDTLGLSGGVNTAGFVLRLGGNGNMVISGNAITGSGGVLKSETGTLTLTAVNTFTGGTQVIGGMLILGDGVNAAALMGGAGADAFSGAGSPGITAVTVNNAAVLAILVNASVTGGTGGLGRGGGSGGGGGSGVAFASGGTLTNNGIISAGGGGGSTTGTDGGGGTGVTFASGGALTNSGSILGGNGGEQSSGLNGGDGGTGVAFASGGTLTNSGTISAGAGGNTNNKSGGNGGTGVVFALGGTLTNSGTISAGARGSGPNGRNGSAGTGVTFAGATGTLGNLSGGIITGGVVMDSAFANSVTLQIGSTITGGLNIGTNTGSTLTLTDNGINASSQSATYSASVGGSTTFGGALIKNGAGTWTLDQPMNYGGGTQVNAGTLIVSGSISGSTTVNDGATLGGTGLAGAVTVTSTSTGGTVDPGLAPGTSTGQLTTGMFSLNSGAHLAMQLGGTTAGAASGGYDQINATGLTLGGDLTITFLGGYTPSINDTFFLLLNSGAAPTGTFSTINLPAGFSATVNYTASAGDGTNGDDVSITFTAIPEPGAAALSLGGLSMLLGFRRRGRGYVRTGAKGIARQERLSQSLPEE